MQPEIMLFMFAMMLFTFKAFVMFIHDFFGVEDDEE